MSINDGRFSWPTGIDPVFADLSSIPGFTPEIVRPYLDAQTKRTEFDCPIEAYFIDMGDTAECLVETALRPVQIRCRGHRGRPAEAPELLLLFEKR